MPPDAIPPAAPDDATKPETPNAKRLSVPDFPLPENPTERQLLTALQNALFQIAENLRYLRLSAEEKQNMLEAHALNIRRNQNDIADLKARVQKLEEAGRR